MNETDRQNAIVSLVKDAQFASVSDIVSVLQVSSATVRRDIAKLDELGVIRKVHGGITAIDGETGSATRGKPFRENQVIQVAQKQAIAWEAEKLCDEGNTIFIHGGTTCSIFSRSLRNKSLKIYTNSFPVAENIWRNDNCHLHLLGGDLHREPAIFYSPQLWDEEFYVSKFFVGTLGISPEGLLENNPLLVRVIEMVVNRTSEVVVLADSSKFAVRARLRALPYNRISTLITDDGISERDAKMIEDAGIRLIVARRDQDVRSD